MIRLHGQLTCLTDEDAAAVRLHLPEHMRLTRAEPGNLSFEVTPTIDPMVWQVDELFTDRAAFEAHQSRNRASTWFAATNAVRREFTIIEE
ncbi:MAG: antibiotic biosynthesis monooxygenase [Paracoccaceae bacterium]